MVKRSTSSIDNPVGKLLSDLFSERYDIQIGLLEDYRKKKLGEVVDLYLQKMPYYERQIIKLNYGIDEFKYDIKGISKQYKMSKRTVSKIKKNAFSFLIKLGLESALNDFFRAKR